MKEYNLLVFLLLLCHDKLDQQVYHKLLGLDTYMHMFVDWSDNTIKIISSTKAQRLQPSGVNESSSNEENLLNKCLKVVRNIDVQAIITRIFYP